MDFIEDKDILSRPKKLKASKKLSGKSKNDFALPIYIQRRKNMGVTITCPDMNITRSLPLPSSYEKLSSFYQDLIITLAEVDRLAIDAFQERDFKTKKKHREQIFPRGLKDHLEVDLQSLKFKPPQAAELTTKSKRTWQRWCKERKVKRRSNGLKFSKRHYLIGFSEIEPFLKPEFIENPKEILRYVTT
jgi:hypothetical protein